MYNVKAEDDFGICYKNWNQDQSASTKFSILAQRTLTFSFPWWNRNPWLNFDEKTENHFLSGPTVSLP